MKLVPFLEEAVTSWHAASVLARRLEGSGFTRLDEADAWKLEAGRGYFILREGAIAAWVAGRPSDGWTIATAHTDSPGWKLKVESARQVDGITRIGTEVYGAPIHATWFDRPLSIAGRVVLRGERGRRDVLVRTEPVGVFANLAIHFNREVNKGFAYDLSDHLCLLAALPESLIETLARQSGFDASDWLAADLFAVNAASAVDLGGFFVAPRIDNLAGCHSVVEGLLRATKPQRMAVCFDNEEVGSSTRTGADSSWLGDLLARVSAASGGTAEDGHRSSAQSFILSVDAAHGVHPNWAAMHDEAFAPRLGQGPALKSSARQSYSTTAAAEARVRLAAQSAGVSLQTFVMKSTLVPGSTVGPIATSWTGMPGADVGIPIWAMHSAAETAHLADQDAMLRLVAAMMDS